MAENPTFHFYPMDEAHARSVLGWQYPPPYDFYNPNPANLDKDIPYLLDLRCPYFYITDQNKELVAFCTYGLDAQVPGGDYSEKALDIGLGIRPDLTGQGQGFQYVHAVVEFGTRKYRPLTLRVTIAVFNERAQRVWQKAGFQFDHQFERLQDKTSFCVYLCPA